MKNVYIIGGTMGVGKTTVSMLLTRKLDNSVFLDGDWCWFADPFQVTDETKEMVVDNICYLLNNYIRCSAYDNIIFCWVMHQQSIIDDILARIHSEQCLIHCVSLVCNEKALIERLRKDVLSGARQPDVIQRSIQRIPFYESLKTIKIDVSDITAEEAAKQILLL